MATVIREDFDSWDAWVDAAADMGRRQWVREGMARRTDAQLPHVGLKAGWNGTPTFDDALRLARYGWEEGREAMAAAMALVNPERLQEVFWQRDVAGAYPDVPMAAAGDPMAMIRPSTRAKSARPVVRIDYGRSVTSDVSNGAIMNRGAAVLGIVDALEQRGFSVELRLVFKTQGDGRAYHSAVAFKAAGEALDIDRAAMALAHPSVQRRLAFALREQHAALEAWGNGMGVSDHSPLDAGDDAAIYVPAASYLDQSPESARANVESLFLSLLGEAA